jgi:hypothetical protein
MMGVFFKSFLFIPLELVLWLVGLTLLLSGRYYLQTGRAVSAKTKPGLKTEKDHQSRRPQDKRDFDVTVESGPAVRRKGLWLMAAGGACLALSVILFVFFVAARLYTLESLIGLLVGLALLVPVAWYFGTPPKSSA